jgi:hypothetical protein
MKQQRDTIGQGVSGRYRAATYTAPYKDKGVARKLPRQRAAILPDQRRSLASSTRFQRHWTMRQRAFPLAE